MKCSICDSTATSLHFGAPSCKACAAFFRRTVALDVIYECVMGKNECEVNFERRMTCKHCRYEKCLKNNMKRDMVQSKKGRYENDNEREEDSRSGSTRNAYHEVQKYTDHILKMDSNLNKSRRMSFTKTTLFDIFSGTCKMPYQKDQLRPSDFREYKGYEKQEYVMMFNYSNALPDFQHLSSADQNFLFRITCGVNFVMSSSFYTCCIGMESNLFIRHDGKYVQMLPLPFVPKLARMNFTFEENALLKALCSWQMAQCNFMEEVTEFINTLIIMSFFEVVEGDTLIKEMLRTSNLFV